MSGNTSETALQVIDAELVPEIEQNKPSVIIDDTRTDDVTPQEARLLIEATETPRDHLMLRLLWKLGARVGELVPTYGKINRIKTMKTPGIKPCDFSRKFALVVTEKKRISTKKKLVASGKWKDRPEPVTKRKIYRRQIPIKPELYAEVAEYCMAMKLNPDEPMFDISTRRVEQILKDAAIKAGITYKNVTPHSLRRGFANHYINSGGSHGRLQKILAHSHIGTTMIYTKNADQDLQRDFDRMGEF